MKKKIKYIGLALGIALLSSCTNYLDIKPFGKVIPKTPEEYATLLNNRLNRLDYGDDEIILGNIGSITDFEMYADNFEACLDPGNSLKICVTEDLGSGLFKRYTDYYEIIRDCNIIINNLSEEGAEKETSDEVMAASYALRGICYYQLLRQYCEVPKNPSEQLGLPLALVFDLEATTLRSTMEESIKQIEKDFLTSLKYGNATELYRFTPDVVKGYLARLYFWSKQWDKAIEYSQPIVAAHPLLKGDEYAGMIDSLYAQTGNIMVKSPIYRKPGQDLPLDNLKEGLKNRPLSKRFLDCFYDEKEKDIRYTKFINKKRISTKIPFACMRSAEMLLIEAEAYYHKGEEAKALELINELRAHRITDAQPLTMETLPELRENELIKVDVNGQPLTKLLNLILTERRKELLSEGDRWFELKRNGSPEFWQGHNGLKYTTEPYMYTFPLPITDIKLLKDLKQNPGYTDILQ